jgi:hypothetical protein
MKIYPAVLSIALFCFLTEASSQKLPKDYKLVYEQSFDGDGALHDFLFTQKDKWILSEGKAGKALEFTGISEYQPPFRSPHTLGFIRNLVVGNFVMEVDLLQTGKEYGHRDMCIAFGLQDPAHFYYAHMATKMDDNAHQIMLVNGAPRAKISLFTTQGVNWGEEKWHLVRIERRIEDGTIKVFFDGVLIEEAKDKTFGAGHIGFGSFDDSGKIDNVRIWSNDATQKELASFQ